MVSNQNLLRRGKAKPTSGTQKRNCKQGQDVSETATPKNVGEVFFLDIPFYRTRHPREA